MILDIVPCELGSEADSEVLCHLVAHVQSGIVPVISVVWTLEERILLEVSNRAHIGKVSVSAGDGHVVGLLGRLVLVNFLNPLAVGSAIPEVCNLLGTELRGTSGIDRSLVVELSINPGVHNSRQFRSLLEAICHIVADLHLSVATLLGGNEDDAVGSPGTVNRSRGCVLQD